MADSEFEEFRQYFDQLPQHIRAPAKCYTLAHDITPCEEIPSFDGFLMAASASVPPIPEEIASTDKSSLKFTPDGSDERKRPAERKRRKLPEIPKNQPVPDFSRTPSLAEELSRMDINSSGSFSSDSEHKPFFRSNLHYRVEEDSPCESDVWPATDGDSGRDSTEHTPLGSKSSSPHVLPRADTEVSTPSESVCGQEATHRGLHKFTARHSDEIDIEIGDPVYVHHEADDCWCDGVNLRTDRRGIFPSAYVIDVDYDFDPDGRRLNKERYVLEYLGSVETTLHKGEEVLCAAVHRIRRLSSKPHPQSCMLEISDHGIHVTDKCSEKTSGADRVPRHDYFFALKNVTFCGFHANEPQYLGFITKHPNEERFACHVFEGKGSTRHVAEAIGRAFQRFCRKFIELAYPVHEFYLE